MAAAFEDDAREDLEIVGDEVVRRTLRVASSDPGSQRSFIMTIVRSLNGTRCGGCVKDGYLGEIEIFSVDRSIRSFSYTIFRPKQARGRQVLRTP